MLTNFLLVMEREKEPWIHTFRSTKNKMASIWFQTNPPSESHENMFGSFSIIWNGMVGDSIWFICNNPVTIWFWFIVYPLICLIKTSQPVPEWVPKHTGLRWTSEITTFSFTSRTCSHISQIYAWISFMLYLNCTLTLFLFTFGQSAN